MTNVVMLVKDRPNLTRQALESLYDNTPHGEFNLVLVDDGSKIETRAILKTFAILHPNVTILSIAAGSKGHTAMARNLGVYWAEHYWGRGEWLYLSDNDVWFKKGWLAKMTEAAIWLGITGGCQHPYHGTNQAIPCGPDLEIHVTDAVAGYSQLMRWKAWESWGPHVETGAAGVGQSEDWAMCRKIVEAGGRVGYVSPSVVLHTGKTNSLGEKATGAEQFETEKGVLYE